MPRNATECHRMPPVSQAKSRRKASSGADGSAAANQLHEERPAATDKQQDQTTEHKLRDQTTEHKLRAELAEVKGQLAAQQQSSKQKEQEASRWKEQAMQIAPQLSQMRARLVGTKMADAATVTKVMTQQVYIVYIVYIVMTQHEQQVYPNLTLK